MPKTAVQTAICDICGADAREGSVFCYNCGGSLAKVDSAPLAAPTPESVKEGSLVISNGHATPEASYQPAKRKIEKENRRKVRAANRQPVEIVWEPRTGLSWPFIIISLVFFLVSIGIVIAAFYVR